MQVNRFDTHIDALAYLRVQGYVHSYVAENKAMRCLETNRYYSPLDLIIVCYHRFEGDKDLGDVSVLYVVEAVDGSRGVIIDGYGVYADSDLAALLGPMPVSARTQHAGLTVD